MNTIYWKSTLLTYLFVVFFIMCSKIGFSQKNDSDACQTIKYTGGVLYSKYITKDPVLANGSVFRRGFFFTSTYDKKVYKYFHVSISISYQERMPFEAFIFSEGSSGGINIGLLFPNWPTNPQNELYNEVDYAIRFPNFRYLHGDLVPTVKLKEAQFLIEAGIGPFFGILLNKGQTTVTKELFDERFHSQFGNAGNNPAIEYRSFDAGICAKMSIGFQIAENSSLLLSSVYNSSLSRLNNTRVSKGTFSDENLKWRTLILGITFQRFIKL